jgi:hypothetical protein
MAGSELFVKTEFDRIPIFKCFKYFSATYTAIAVVSTFVILHLPRIAASTHEVANTKLIIFCIESGRQYIPTINFYKVDSVARLLVLISISQQFYI